MLNEKPNFNLQKQVKRYYQLTIYIRWTVILILWLTLGIYGIWGIRHEIQLWLEHFTWSALRYGLAFNAFYTLCLGVCIGSTISVLLWQSSHIIWGLSDKEKYYLEQEVKKILVKGSSHPLWKWIQ